MSGLTFQFAPYWLLVCVLAGVLYALVLYYRETHFTEAGQKPKWWLYALAVVRAVVVFFIAALLLSPLLKLVNHETEKPIILLAQDNSASIGMHFKQQDSAAYTSNFNKLRDALSKNYEVKTYLVGSKVREGAQADYKDGSTNLSDFFEQVQNLFSNQNLGAIILASDGVYNEGSNPVYSAGEKMAPVYTIALGDTTVKRDLLISKMYFNPVAYLGNNFSVRADVQAQNCKGEAIKLQVFRVEENTNRLLQEQSFTAESDYFVKPAEFTFAADKPGIIHYRFVLNQLSDEVTFANNTTDVFVEVLEVKEKVLLLANAPHPDIAALKQAIESNKNYECDIVYAQGNNADVKDYSLIIFHQLPSGAQTAQGIIAAATAQKKSMLFITGAQTSISLFNGAQDALKINGGNNSMGEATAAPENDFTLFNLSTNAIQALQAFPPLKVPFGDYRPAPSTVVLAYQKIGNVSTKYPLISFYQSLDSKIGIICGEGTWRWRNYDFLQHKTGDLFNEIITRTVQYLSVKPDKKQFRVTPENRSRSGNERMFSESETVIFNSELYNDTYEPVNQPDVKLLVTDEKGKEFNYVMNRNGTGYTLNAGSFASGSYSYTASVIFNNKSFTEKGEFMVSLLQLENSQTRADHQLLNLLSTKSGGKLFYPNQIDELIKTIQTQDSIKPVIYTTQKTESVINLKWIFFLLAGLLSVEWFVRKYNGGY